MSETTSWTDHVLNGQAWLRFLFMLLFTPLLGCIGFMVLCLGLFQFFSVLASGESNPQLRDLGRDLNRLGVDIVAFLTYNTDRKPFPFTANPPDLKPEQSGQGGKFAASGDKTADGADAETTDAQSAATPSATRRKATSRKKSATRKKTSTRKKTTRHTPEKQ